MAGPTLKVSVEEMQSAASRCQQLEQKIAECRQELVAMNQQLQGMWEGESARAFEEFVNGTAAPILGRCSEMCADTARGITQTCQQFADADKTLSGAFKG